MEFVCRALLKLRLNRAQRSTVWHISDAKKWRLRAFVLAQVSLEFGVKFFLSIDPPQHLPRGPTLEWLHINEQCSVIRVTDVYAALSEGH